MKLFQSLFGGGETPGRYPESFIEAAIERAADGTDSRLRLLPGYRKRLRQPVIQAADHIIGLVDDLSVPVTADRHEHGTDPRLAALFASAADMLEIFGRDAQLKDFVATSEGRGAARLTTLLLPSASSETCSAWISSATRCAAMCPRWSSASPGTACSIRAPRRRRPAVC